MEKVKLTKDQAEAIENFKKIKMTIQDFANAKYEGGFKKNLKSLNRLSVDGFAKAMLIGYEVEETFKSGDKVLWNKEIITLTERNQKFDNAGLGHAWNFKESSGWLGEEQFRHATPEEIYWLETLGRKKVNEFRRGDTVLDTDGSITRLTTDFHLAHAISWYRDRPEELVGIYPDESFKQFPKEETK